MKEEKEGEVEAKVTLRKNIIRDVNYLLSKGLVTESEVYYLVKSFLKDYLGLEYEFTHKELISELKNVYLPYNIRSDFFKFIEQVFMFEYSDVKYSDQELKMFLEEFKHYIDYLLVAKAEKSSLGAFVILRKLRIKIRERIAQKKKEKEEREKSGQEDEKPKENLSLEIQSPVMANHIDMNSIIEKIYYGVYNSDLDGATTLYKELVTLYNDLPAEEKINYYEPLLSVYNSIKEI